MCFILVFTLALCSIVYELVLGQMLAALNGNTISQYSIVIGLYIANLGLGALTVGLIDPRDSAKGLFKIEIALTVLGGLSPFILLFLKSLTTESSMLLYFMICLVGFLSGMEIPLVSSWFKESNQKKSHSFILGADYFGSVFGCVIFPFIFLPQIGLFLTALFMGALNLVVAIFMLNSTSTFSKKNLLGLGFVLVSFITIAIYLDDISGYFVGRAFSWQS